jgi:hypothetical protein
MPQSLVACVSPRLVIVTMPVLMTIVVTRLMTVLRMTVVIVMSRCVAQMAKLPAVVVADNPRQVVTGLPGMAMLRGNRQVRKIYAEIHMSVARLSERRGAGQRQSKNG